MTRQADEIRRMADTMDRLHFNLNVGPESIYRKAAAMLREYAEGVEVTDAMVERALVGYWGSDGGWNPERDQDPFWTDGCRKDMRAALTAALSGREDA